MNLLKILLELKVLDLYSLFEWDRYLSYFEKSKEKSHFIHNKYNSFSQKLLIARIKRGVGAISENVNSSFSHKITDTNSLEILKEKYTLGVVSGSFDLLHLGHVESFGYAKKELEKIEKNSRLCALVLSDKNIKIKKGPSRPILNINERLEMLCGVKCLDYVLPLEEPDCVKVLRNIKPDFFCKSKRDQNEDIVKKEIEVVKGYGGKIITLPQSKERSTSEIIEILKAK